MTGENRELWEETPKKNREGEKWGENIKDMSFHLKGL